LALICFVCPASAIKQLLDMFKIVCAIEKEQKGTHSQTTTAAG